MREATNPKTQAPGQSGDDRMVELVETMMTADGLQLIAYGPSENEMRIVEDLAKAKPPQVVAK